MKTLIAFFLIITPCLFSNLSFSQTFNLVQTFEASSSGSDGCWVSYSRSAMPTPSSNFFIETNLTKVHSGSQSGGMYVCCGVGSKGSTRYISPVLAEGLHSVSVYVRQSSSSNFNERFDVGTVTSDTGANFVTGYTKTTWPFPIAWQLCTLEITTDAVNNRIALQLSPNAVKTYFLDSLVIGNAGNSNSSCTYAQVTSTLPVEFLSSDISVFPTPFSDQISFEAQGKQASVLKIYDLTSRLLIQKKGSNFSNINTANLNRGLYLYEMWDENSLIYKGKIMKQ